MAGADSTADLYLAPQKLVSSSQFGHVHRLLKKGNYAQRVGAGRRRQRINEVLRRSGKFLFCYVSSFSFFLFSYRFFIMFVLDQYLPLKG